ncbi:hypothetical protein ES708_22417 [subsurface metagenome]
MVIGIKGVVLEFIAENEVRTPEHRRGYLGIEAVEHMDDKTAFLPVALHLIKPAAEDIGYRSIILQLMGMLGEDSIKSSHQRREVGKPKHLLGVASVAGKDIAVFAGVFYPPPGLDMTSGEAGRWRLVEMQSRLNDRQGIIAAPDYAPLLSIKERSQGSCSPAFINVNRPSECPSWGIGYIHGDTVYITAMASVGLREPSIAHIIAEGEELPLKLISQSNLTGGDIFRRRWPHLVL